MAYEDTEITKRQFNWAVFSPIAPLVVVLLFSGDIFWAEGWIFGVWFITMWESIFFYLYNHDKNLLIDWFQQREFKDKLGWDKKIMQILAGVLVFWLIIMPIDSRLFHLSKGFPDWLQDVALIGLFISYFILIRSFVDTTVLSPLIRIQFDRKQEIVTHGVYNFVRHPFYLGITLMFLFTPLELGSYYGLGIGLILTAIVVYRIIGEEELLVEKLDKYVQYKNLVNFRLFPLIW